MDMIDVVYGKDGVGNDVDYEYDVIYGGEVLFTLPASKLTFLLEMEKRWNGVAKHKDRMTHHPSITTQRLQDWASGRTTPADPKLIVRVLATAILELEGGLAKTAMAERLEKEKG